MIETLKGKTGMELLKEAFPEPGSQEPRETESRNGVRPFDDDFWNGPISDEDAEVSDWVDREVREKGIEALAWYNPYRFYGEKYWGIYFDEQKMNAYAAGIYRQVKKIRPSATYSEVRRIVWKAVERHEYEHCVQELVLASGIIHGALVPPDLSCSPIASELEAIATHQEILDPSVRDVSDKQLLNLTMFIMGQSPMPSGYADWNRVDIENLENKFINLVDRYLPKKLLKTLRSKLLSTRGAVWLEVPKWLV